MVHIVFSVLISLFEPSNLKACPSLCSYGANINALATDEYFTHYSHFVIQLHFINTHKYTPSPPHTHLYT